MLLAPSSLDGTELGWVQRVSCALLRLPVAAVLVDAACLPLEHQSAAELNGRYNICLSCNVVGPNVTLSKALRTLITSMRIVHQKGCTSSLQFNVLHHIAHGCSAKLAVPWSHASLQDRSISLFTLMSNCVHQGPALQC